ncbi:MAG: DUF2605 family protein [Synechococcaceae bacterium WBB_3_034]|nr:DUF2605 family protein [Synechococcaceae bacterium WBB_3_034]NDG23364.1 DUF2605 family protein [Synechococcaceae bacterium WBB_10_009]
MSESPAPQPSGAASPQEPAALLDQLLESLFEDFVFWFERGLLLLEHTPEPLLPPGERNGLRHDLQEGLRAIAAARALRGACSAPMAVDLEAMAPWHRLMMRVWSLSSLLRAAGVALPEGG